MLQSGIIMHHQSCRFFGSQLLRKHLSFCRHSRYFFACPASSQIRNNTVQKFSFSHSHQQRGYCSEQFRDTFVLITQKRYFCADAGQQSAELREQILQTALVFFFSLSRISCKKLFFNPAFEERGSSIWMVKL